MLGSLFNKVTGLQACNFTKKRLQHRRFPMNIANFKNTYFEKHLQTAASDSSYILHRKLNKIIQEPDWPFVSFLLTLVLIHSFYHSLSFAVTDCHLLLLVVTCWTTRCLLLYQSLSFVVTRRTTRSSFLGDFRFIQLMFYFLFTLNLFRNDHIYCHSILEGFCL